MTKQLLPPIIALVALTLYGAFLMRHASYAVGGSDSSGYANIARSLTTGRLVERVEMLDRFALPDGFASAFAPLAYLLGPRPGTLTPFYPVGLPLHLAVAAIIGGWRSGPFFVVPILATLSLLFIYLAGRELDLSRALAGTSALMLGICPVFLFQAQWVMSDVAATFWALVAVFASLRARRRAAWALLAGFAFGIGVLVRPTSALMLIPVLFGLPLRPRCLLFFALGGLPTAMILFVYDLTAYGSIWRTGYGQIGLTDALTFHGFNARFRHYIYWLAAMMSPLPLIGWLGAAFDRRILWRYRVLLMAWFGAFLLFFSCYEIYQEWWYTRFLLPGIPALILASLLAARDLGAFVGGERLRGALKAVPVVLLLLVTIGFAQRLIQRFSVLENGRGQLSHRISCRRADILLPKQTLVLSMEMSGALKFYTGRPIVRWDLVEPPQMDALKWTARAQGYYWAALLLPEEVEPAQRRLPGRWQLITEVGSVSLWMIDFD